MATNAKEEKEIGCLYKVMTEFIVAVVFIGLVIWTSVAQRYGYRTVSQVMRDVSWNWSIVPTIIGMLTSHWLFSGEQILNSWGWGIGIPLFVVLLVKDGYLKYTKANKKSLWYQRPYFYLALGLIVGFLFWRLPIGE